jgi:hypothetical protein
MLHIKHDVEGAVLASSNHANDATALVLVRSSCCLEAQGAKRRSNLTAERAATTTHRRYCRLSAWIRLIQLVEQLILRPLVLNARSMEPTSGGERTGAEREVEELDRRIIRPH